MEFKILKTCLALFFAATILSSCQSRAAATSPTIVKELASNPQQVTLSPQSVSAASSQSTSSLFFTPPVTPTADLSFPAVFAITRPLEKLTTTYETYFITGTSDPTIPLYFEGTEVIRLGTRGAFGVQTKLAVGTNTFSLKQGKETLTVTIIRKEPAAAAKITDIVKSSIFPSVMAGVKVSQPLTVECTAPSGGIVSATFDGQTVSLKQVADVASGLPVVFRGTLTIAGDYPTDLTTNAGKVTYTLNYNGGSKEYISSGDVFVAGKNSNIAVEITSYIGSLYTDLKADVIRERLKQGATDYIRSQTNSYFELANGGFIPVDQAKIIEGKVAIDNKFSKVYTSYKSKFEAFTLSGTASPSYITKLTDTTFAITFFNTTSTPSIDLSSSKIFSSCTTTENDVGVTYTFTISNPAKFWGYQVFYQDGNTVLRFAYKPTIGTGNTPLAGVTVMLDPGHGGDTVGALGVAGKTGPFEEAINIAHAYATRDALEEMGAKVLFTRINTNPSLDDRIEAFEQSGADIFVSIHHNSLRESVDANTVSGIEIYYHNKFSLAPANSVMNGLTLNLNRNNRNVTESYYRVTLSPYAPSFLVELGYISNPLEYEKSTDPIEIAKAGKALADGIKLALDKGIEMTEP